MLWFFTYDIYLYHLLARLARALARLAAARLARARLLLRVGDLRAATSATGVGLLGALGLTRTRLTATRLGHGFGWFDSGIYYIENKEKKKIIKY